MVCLFRSLCAFIFGLMVGLCECDSDEAPELVAAVGEVSLSFVEFWYKIIHCACTDDVVVFPQLALGESGLEEVVRSCHCDCQVVSFTNSFLVNALYRTRGIYKKKVSSTNGIYTKNQLPSSLSLSTSFCSHWIYLTA